MRLRDWTMRFAALCADRRGKPFAWGSHDCCLWAADAVQAITGTDFAADHRGAYDDAIGAARLVSRLGGLSQIATDALGDPINPNRATVGDVVLIENQGRELLGVCNGSVALAPGPDGLIAVGMSSALAAWKV